MSTKTKEPKPKFDFKDFIKLNRIDYFITSILCIALGVLLIIYTNQAIQVCGWVVAAALIVIGLVNVIIYFVKLAKGLPAPVLSLVVGATVIVVGFWVFKNIADILTLIFIVIGVIMIAHAGRGFYEAITAKKLNKESAAWAIPFVFAIINFVLGILCVLNAFEVLEFSIIVFGVIMIVHGITNLYTAGYIVVVSKKVKKAFANAAAEAGPIDVTFEEDRNPDENAEQEQEQGQN